MKRPDDEVNRNIDTETAEGHRISAIEMVGETGKKAVMRNASALDDEAEGHVVRRA